MALTYSPTPSRHRQATGGADRASIRVLVVDDHSAVRVGVRALIDDQPDMRVVAEARSVAETLHRLDAPIDVAVVDYHLRQGRDGLTLIPHLKRAFPDCQVLVYSAFADTGLALTALVAGADGLLGKHELPDELCEAIRRLARGRHHLPGIPPAVVHAMGARLEPGDQPIFAMLAHGTSPEEIAMRLRISPEQLETRRAMILRALKPPRTQLNLPPLASTPLDYERPKRRLARSVA